MIADNQWLAGVSGERARGNGSVPVREGVSLGQRTNSERRCVGR